MNLWKTTATLCSWDDLQPATPGLSWELPVNYGLIDCSRPTQCRCTFLWAVHVLQW